MEEEEKRKRKEEEEEEQEEEDRRRGRGGGGTHVGVEVGDQQHGVEGCGRHAVDGHPSHCRRLNGKRS